MPRPTQDEIYRQGLEALRERLGRAGMVRFMQQFETGHGNYAVDRHEWVDRMSLDDLRAAAKERTARKKRPKR
jgi:hypothetical protein